MESITKTNAPSVQITVKEIEVTSPEQLIPILVRKLLIPLKGTTRQMLNYLQNDALKLTNNDLEIMFMMTVVVIKSLENGDQTPAVLAAIQEKKQIRDDLFYQMCNTAP